jgi:stage V sporulation protein R
MNEPLVSNGTEWTFSLINQITKECETIAREELHLKLYRNQIEIISSEQMLDAYASVGMPVMYHHWSWGKAFARNEYSYRKGFQGLAYEIVLNSSPCISYLMEENTMTMQTLVIAHAALGHNSFFAMNEFVRQWTDAEGIMDYLIFAKDFVAECEEKYGYDEVESILDSAHALQSHGVDRYTRPTKLSASEEKAYAKKLIENEEKEINELWSTLPKKVRLVNEHSEEAMLATRQKILNLPEENLLYFIEKKSPVLKSWQRELVRIVRKISQYFYPQKQTQVANEGWASFVHYYIMHRLHDKGIIDDGAMLEFLQSHSSVLHQLPFDHKAYSGFNPYALGFAIYQEIKRICENPTNEDKVWFPELIGKDWLEEVTFAMKNFRDESFIRQYLSPELIRRWHLFAIDDDSKKDHVAIERIHNERGYKKIRSILADQYNLSNREPDLQVWDVDLLGNRSLKLRHFKNNDIPLHSKTDEVVKHIVRLWGYEVILESFNITTNTSDESYKMSKISSKV